MDQKPNFDILDILENLIDHPDDYEQQLPQYNALIAEQERFLRTKDMLDRDLITLPSLGYADRVQSSPDQDRGYAAYVSYLTKKDSYIKEYSRILISLTERYFEALFAYNRIKTIYYFSLTNEEKALIEAYINSGRTCENGLETKHKSLGKTQAHKRISEILKKMSSLYLTSDTDSDLRRDQRLTITDTFRITDDTIAGKESEGE